MVRGSSAHVGLQGHISLAPKRDIYKRCSNFVQSGGNPYVCHRISPSLYVLSCFKRSVANVPELIYSHQCLLQLAEGHRLPPE
jgi:hypothetical protein